MTDKNKEDMNDNAVDQINVADPDGMGYAVDGDIADTRMGWGCTACARFEFDTNAPRKVEKMACGACGGHVRYMTYSAWKLSRPELFPND